MEIVNLVDKNVKKPIQNEKFAKHLMDVLI